MSVLEIWLKTSLKISSPLKLACPWKSGVNRFYVTFAFRKRQLKMTVLRVRPCYLMSWSKAINARSISEFFCLSPEMATEIFFERDDKHFTYNQIPNWFFFIAMHTFFFSRINNDASGEPKTQNDMVFD